MNKIQNPISFSNTNKDAQSCFFINETRVLFPDVDIETLKNAILGKSYVLSVVCTSKKKIQDLNKEYRDKDYIPNILSFPYDSSKRIWNDI
jgi:ssRNA-specific RNase YbeY (16S rRNA maturation enzyme)